MPGNPRYWIEAIRTAMHTTDCAAKQQVLANAADNLERMLPAENPDGWNAGVLACVAWVEKRRHDFESEHGMIDFTTGAMEFGSRAREEYDAELGEIEEGLRALAATSSQGGSHP